MENILYKNELYCFEIFISIKKLSNGMVIVDNPTDDNSHLVRFLAAPPKFDVVSCAFEDSTYMNNVTGSAFVRSSILYKNIFKNAIKIIDFVDLDIDQIKVEEVNFNDLNYNLVKMISKAWLKDVL